MRAVVTRLTNCVWSEFCSGSRYNYVESFEKYRVEITKHVEALQTLYDHLYGPTSGGSSDSSNSYASQIQPVDAKGQISTELLERLGLNREDCHLMDVCTAIDKVDCNDLSVER